MTVSHEHAVEVDTRLSELWEQAGKASLDIHNAIQSLHSSLRHERNVNLRYGDPGSYKETAKETEAQGREVIANPVEGRHWYAYDGKLHPQTSIRYITEALAELDAARASMAAAKAEEIPLVHEYAQDPWPRFFLVVNTNGHIHRNMACATTFPTTRWAWLPSLSGLGEDAAVAEQGPRLCSVCYPSAPVEWTLGLPKKLNPKRCDGSGEQALNQNYRYYTPRGTCPVCGTGVAISSTGKARAHNKPKGEGAND